MKCSLKLMLLVLMAILIVAPYALKDAHFIFKAGFLAIPLVSLWVELDLYLQQKEEEVKVADAGLYALQLAVIYASLFLAAITFISLIPLMNFGDLLTEFDIYREHILLVPTLTGFVLSGIVIPVFLFVIWKKVHTAIQVKYAIEEKSNRFRRIMALLCSSVAFLVADLSLTVGVSVISLIYS